MENFIPLYERTSQELKAMARAVDGSIRKSLPIAFEAQEWEWEILDELETLSFLIKRELAVRWKFCQQN